MKILHVISSVNPAGGGPIEGVKQLGATLVSGGNRVEIASLDPPSAPYLDTCPLPCYALGPATFDYAFAPRFMPWLRENHSHYDAVIVNGLWQFHSFAAWKTLRHSTTPYVIYTHGMLDPWFKEKYPLKHLKKWLYWPWAEYRVLRDAQAVLFTCEEERVLARRSFWLYRCNEVVVRYGTAKPQGDPEAEVASLFRLYPELQKKRLALFMGRIHPKKGCDLLLEAFAKVLAPHDEWHLVMAGPDQVGWQKALRQRAGELGISDRVTWTGLISGTIKLGALRGAEIFALPSHQENFGIVVAEALAANTPALISNKVNIWREIEAERAGLVADDTVTGTCSLFERYLEMPADKKLRMRRQARQCFDRNFEIQKAAATLKAVLTGITRAN